MSKAPSVFSRTLALGALMWATPASAEPTLELYIRGAEEVFEGDPESTSVDALGRISAGPRLFDLAPGVDRPMVTMARGPGDAIYAGTAGGGLVRVDAKGRAKVVAPLVGKVVSALAMKGGDLFAATAPDGEIAKVERDGAVTPYFQPDAKYVWAMLPDREGLLVATGAPGRVLRVMPGGRSEVVLDPKETHVRAMIRHPKRGLVAGGGQKGIVYQLTDDGPFALYDSALEEVTAFAVDDRTGDLYAAVVSASENGALEPRTWVGPVEGDEEDTSSPIKSSEVVRIRPSGHVEKVWTSNREGALALTFDARARRLYIATGTGKKSQARVYAVDTEDRDRVLLFARLAPPLATAMLPADAEGALIVGTAPAGRVIRVGPGYVKDSVYLSVEQDLERISEIGRLWFDADVPKGARVAVRLRTGNTKTPDDTWSDWSRPVTDPEGGNVDVRKGRYAQLKAELTASPRGEAPVLASMHASVVRMNLPPEVQEIFVLRRGVYMKPLPEEGEKERTITLSSSILDKLRRRHAPERNRTRVKQGEEPGMMTIGWEAEDDNGDDLLFRLEIRRLDGPKGPTRWRTMVDDAEHAFWSFDSRAYPDGRYQVRVTASDRPANPPDAALVDGLLSEPFVIDNAPPRITQVDATMTKDGVRVTARAEDAASMLEDAQVALDGGPWLMLPATDGLIDDKVETFEVVLGRQDGPGSPDIDEGPHVVRVRVIDRANNEASASARFTAD